MKPRWNLQKFTSLAFLHLCWRDSQPNATSMSLTLDVLQYHCCVYQYHAAFHCIDSRQLISLMLFWYQREFAYSSTGLMNTLQDLPFTKEEPILRVLLNRPWVLLALLVMLMCHPGGV